jgi:hypothetical protein
VDFSHLSDTLPDNAGRSRIKCHSGASAGVTVFKKWPVFKVFSARKNG